MSIVLPLNIGEGGLRRTNDIKESVDSFISLLLNTPCNSCVSDPRFGFIFNNLRFEIFNENEGVVYNSDLSNTGDSLQDLYAKKISGSSKNLNTFAAELQSAVILYEKRLSNVSVTMTYIREEKNIYVTVKGIIIDTQTDYLYTTNIRVWN